MGIFGWLFGRADPDSDNGETDIEGNLPCIIRRRQREEDADALMADAPYADEEQNRQYRESCGVRIRPRGRT